MKLSLTDTKY